MCNIIIFCIKDNVFVTKQQTKNRTSDEFWWRLQDKFYQIAVKINDWNNIIAL